MEENIKEKKCESIKDFVRCDKPATWRVIGHSAQYGVPLTKYVCNEHKDFLEKHSHPKIIENDIKYIPLNLGKCCDDMNSAIESKFLTIKNEEIVFNIAKIPQSAGNVLTGETFDPKNYPYSMSLRYCPFCRARLSYYQESDW